jgi:hypothetical protein
MQSWPTTNFQLKTATPPSLCRHRSPQWTIRLNATLSVAIGRVLEQKLHLLEAVAAALDLLRNNDFVTQSQ